MNDLSNRILRAHGGLARWERVERVRAHLVQGGALWGLKGKPGVLDDVDVTVATRRQWASHAPFGASGRRSSFERDRVAIETDDGRVVEERRAPRASFAGHTLETPWDDLQLAFFAGCALWTYLNAPFLLAWPGVTSKELTPWEENGETWHRLRVTYPEDLEVFSKQQTLYCNEEGLLTRLDYDVEIAGNTPGAHYVSDYRSIEGIRFPTRRRIYPRQPDGTAAPAPLVVSIDLDRIELG